MSLILKDFDSSCCLICGNHISPSAENKTVCRKPEVDSISNINECLKQRDQFSRTSAPEYTYCRKIIQTYGVDYDLLIKSGGNRDEIGQKLVDKFVNERLVEGKKSAWDTLPRATIRTFVTSELKSSNPKEKMKREEKHLLQRFLAVSKNRPEFDVEETVSTYEFCDIPRPAFFDYEGKLLLANDKSKVLRNIEDTVLNSKKIEPKEKTSDEQQPSPKKVWIIDGMAVVHSIILDKETSCHSFAEIFLKIIAKTTEFADEVCLVFDR